MIYSVTVEDPGATPIKHFAQVPWLAAGKRIDFAPGLNVVVGPNGSGKSTLLRAIAAMFCVTRASYPTSEDWYDLFVPRRADWRSGPQQLLPGLTIKHDGQSPLYIDTALPPGRQGRLMDLTHFAVSRREAPHRERSEGQANLERLRAFVAYHEANPPPALCTLSERWRATPERRNGSFVHHAAAWDEWIVGTPWVEGSDERGPRTLILDEPDRALDWKAQLELWTWLEQLGERHQIIAAGHSPFALRVGRLIETEAGYADKTLAFLQEHFG